MLGLCCEETYGPMTNHNNIDDNGYNDSNKDKHYNENSAYGSVSNGQIFNPVATPCSCLGLEEEDRVTNTTALQPWCLMYLRVGIYLPYKYHINAIVNICNKLLYAKISVFYLCC